MLAMAARLLFFPGHDSMQRWLGAWKQDEGAGVEEGGSDKGGVTGTLLGRRGAACLESSERLHCIVGSPYMSRLPGPGLSLPAW